MCNICNIFCDRAIFPSTLMSSVSSWCWSLLILGALLKHFKDLLTSAEAQILHKAPNLTNLRPARKYFMIWVLCRNAQGQIRVDEWLTNIRNPFLVMTQVLKKEVLCFLNFWPHQCQSDESITQKFIVTEWFFCTGVLLFRRRG